MENRVTLRQHACVLWLGVKPDVYVMGWFTPMGYTDVYVYNQILVVNVCECQNYVSVTVFGLW